MAEHLLTLLGVGPNDPDQDLRREYRTATYYLHGGSAKFESPFVGEALVRLHPGRFAHVHTYGTVDSMWATLGAHLGPSPDEDDAALAAWDRLGTLVRERRLGEESEVLRWVEERFEAFLGVPMTAHLIPLGTSRDEYWAMLAEMVALPAEADVVSMDVTHGLRSAPLFLFQALQHLRLARPGLRQGSVFYGALDLSRRYDGRTPIFDLGATADTPRWTEAGQAFARYTDAEPIALLLSEMTSVPGTERLADALQVFARQVAINTTTGIRRAADGVLDALDAVAAGALPLLDLVRTALRALPSALSEKTHEWERLLVLARHHWDHGRAGLAVMAAFEAIVARLALVYGLSTSRREDHATLARAVRTVRDFKQLVRWRNGIAHTRSQLDNEEPFQPVHVYQHFPRTLDFLERELPDGRPIQWLRDRVSLDDLARGRED